MALGAASQCVLYRHNTNEMEHEIDTPRRAAHSGRVHVVKLHLAVLYAGAAQVLEAAPPGPWSERRCW